MDYLHPSRGHAEPGIALRQRVIVDEELQNMYAGRPPEHYAVVGNMVADIYHQFGSRPLMLLDAAAGSAYYSEIIEHYTPGWIRYTGLDYNLGMVRMAQEYYPQLPIVHADVQYINFPDRSFDMVLSSATINHISDWRRAVQELSRVARQWLLLHRVWVYLDDKPTHHTVQRGYGQDIWFLYHNRQELIQLVADQGMVLVQDCSAGKPPHGDWQSRTYLFERRGLM